MIISLCGFMGCGKSTIGRGLAKVCNCRFIDLDDYMEAKWAMAVSSIFEKKGEGWFRKEECEALKEIVDEYNYLNAKEPYTLVLALGGGTVTYGPSADVIKKETHCVYLQCPKEMLLERLVKNNSRRPLVAGKSEGELAAVIDDLMAEREEIYKRSAKEIFSVDGKRKGEILRSFSQKYGL